MIPIPSTGSPAIDRVARESSTVQTISLNI
jgi:hypothetical protein